MEPLEKANRGTVIGVRDRGKWKQIARWPAAAWQPVVGDRIDLDAPPRLRGWYRVTDVLWKAVLMEDGEISPFRIAIVEREAE